MNNQSDKSLLLERLMRDTAMRLRPLAMSQDKERLGPTLLMTLITLRSLPAMPVLEIARHLRRDKSQTAKLVKVLEGKKLVKIQRDDEDQRVKLVSLTTRGINYSTSLLGVWREISDSVLEPLNEEQKRQFFGLLEIIYSEDELEA